MNLKKKKTKNAPTFLFTIYWLDNTYTRYLWRARRWTFTPSPSKIDLFPNKFYTMQILKGLQYSGTLLIPTPPTMELCSLWWYRDRYDRKRKRHLFSLPSVPPAVRFFPLSPDPTHILIYHTTQRVPCEAERERGRGSCMNGVFVFVTVQTSKELEPKYTRKCF